MNTWQILLLDMLLLLGPHKQPKKPPLPKPLTVQQQKQFKTLFKAGKAADIAS
jgi:hypothetical protein